MLRIVEVCSITVLLIFCKHVLSAKILGVFPAPGYSQFILAEKLMTELAKRGHEVTVIAPYKPKENLKNYKTVLTDGLLKMSEAGDTLELAHISTIYQILQFYEYTHVIAEYTLASEAVQKFIHSQETFDLVIVEQFGTEALMGFAKHFNVPLISFTSIGFSEWNSRLVGNVRLPSVNPLISSPFSNRMSFSERLQNTLFITVDVLYRELSYYPKQQQLLSKYFPEQIDLQDVLNNVSLLLMNSHYATTDPAFLTTSVIEVGGFHVSAKQLPTDLKKFMDEAKEGVILLSMGSNIQATSLPKEKLDAILKVISSARQRVLWKFENQNMPNKPDNLYVSKWLPQADILAHPNVVAFITHSGLLSTTESIYNGVPMIGIPIFGDQKMNLRRAVEKGMAMELSYQDLSEESLTRALKEILENSSYKENARKYSRMMKQGPINPLDLAMYWIEHILEHNGGSHLRNSSMDLYWFQLYILDVILFLSTIFILVIYLIRCICKSITFKRTENQKLKSS